MKLKKGNLVKVIEDGSSHSYKKGDIVRIEEINGSIAPYRCSRIEDGLQQWLDEQDIVLVKYTWEDFLKSPIGTKVTFENEETLIKTDEGCESFVNDNYVRNYTNLKDFYDNIGLLGKIIKIEEPTYITVYESEVKEMTIDDIEKELGYKIKIVKEK